MFWSCIKNGIKLILGKKLVAHVINSHSTLLSLSSWRCYVKGSFQVDAYRQWYRAHEWMTLKSFYAQSVMNRNETISLKSVLLSNLYARLLQACLSTLQFVCSHFNYICWFCHGNHYQAMLIESSNVYTNEGDYLFCNFTSIAIQTNRAAPLIASNIAHLLLVINKNDKYFVIIS